MAQQDDTQDRRSIDLKTLVIAAAAAVTAAVVTSLFWQKGTLISTALTPVIVALTQEILRRPAEKVQATASKVTAAPVRGVGALAAVGGGRTPDAERFDERRLLDREHGDAGSNGGPANGNGAAPPPPFDDTRAYDPSRSAGSDVPGDTAPAAAAGQPPERRLYGRRRFRWKIALLTGLAAFAIAAVVLTVSELALGESVGGDGRTSLFSGGDSGSEQAGDADSSSDEESNPDEAAPSDSSESQAAPEEESESVAPEEEPAPAEEEPAPAEEEPVEPQSVPASE
jgi:hypothetical protein